MTLGLAIAIAAGGGLGALLRFGAQLLWPARGASVPLAVLLVNVVGSAIGGVFLALTTTGSAPLVSSAVALVIATGFCGGLTTFSTFSVETVELAASGAWRSAAANVGLNVVLGLGAAGLAFAGTNAVIILTSGALVG